MNVGKLGEESRAHKPEPGDPQDAEKHIPLPGRMDEDLPGLGDEVEADFQIGLGGAGRRNVPARNPPQHRHRDHHNRDDGDAAFGQYDLGAEDGAGENRQEGTGGDQGVAAHELIVLELVRKNAVFDGAEEGGLDTHQEQHRHEHGDAAGIKPDRTHRHDDDFSELDAANEFRLVEFVSELARCRRKEKERQNEYACGRRDHNLRVHPRRGGEPPGDEHHHGVLEYVVVEGAQKLGQEQWQEAPGLKKGELCLAHGRFPLRRDCREYQTSGKGACVGRSIPSRRRRHGGEGRQRLLNKVVFSAASTAGDWGSAYSMTVAWTLRSDSRNE